MRTKKLAYSFPTSINAERAGHGKTGIWTIHILGENHLGTHDPEKGRLVFTTPDTPGSTKARDEALQEIEAIDLPYHRFSFTREHFKD